jgi:hypothetical protein
MKKLLVALAAVLVTVASYGQGTVDFNNYTQNGGNGAPIWDVGGPGTRGPGAGFTAALLVNGVQAGTTDFSTAAGFENLLNPVPVTVAGVAGGSTVTFEVQVWSTAAGSYLAASTNPLYKYGTSGSFAGALGGAGNPAGPPSNLDNLPSFTLVPEPSTIALGVIGGLALLLRRRK